MRCLRQSLFVSLEYSPSMTTVVRDQDVKDTLESIRLHTQSGALIISDIFEMPDGTSIEEASQEGVRRQKANEQREANQAMLFYWSVKEWQRLNPNGRLIMDKPAPLTRPEMAEVLTQLAKHPEYKDFYIVGHTETGERIILDKGVLQFPSDLTLPDGGNRLT